MASVEWDAKMVRTITWLEGVSLPAEAHLTVASGEVVEDLERYRRVLVREARRGPACPRAAYGGLQRDILDLRSAVLEREFMAKLEGARSVIELRRMGEELAPIVKERLIRPEGVARLQACYRKQVGLLGKTGAVVGREL